MQNELAKKSNNSASLIHFIHKEHYFELGGYFKSNVFQRVIMFFCIESMLVQRDKYCQETDIHRYGCQIMFIKCVL